METNTQMKLEETSGLDRGNSMGLSAIHRREKEVRMVREVMVLEGMKDEVMSFIFDGDTESVSPLQSVRDEARK